MHPNGFAASPSPISMKGLELSLSLGKGPSGPSVEFGSSTEEEEDEIAEMEERSSSGDPPRFRFPANSNIGISLRRVLDMNQVPAADRTEKEKSPEKKTKKLRLSAQQSAQLEQSFNLHNTLGSEERAALAKQLNLRPRQVEVWFQNRRARTKLKHAQMECKYMKRCCEALRAENRRLIVEIAEIRAGKLSPRSFPLDTPVCISCDRGAVAGGDATSVARWCISRSTGDGRRR
ncbi:homeobox-leucine zipper protein HOX11-like [Zingiber officinale]|uniref:homeobox-leucine zipper protein HOX11-like n=1 Tax=Zingiber officinale TaxID=94328 RepID=UPI001C4A96AB|nr:homeobox-leucine zipper protein HOX11-like [Zingiber officinale]